VYRLGYLLQLDSDTLEWEEVKEGEGPSRLQSPEGHSALLDDSGQG